MCISSLFMDFSFHDSDVKLDFFFFHNFVNTYCLRLGAMLLKHTYISLKNIEYFNIYKLAPLTSIVRATL